MPLTLTAVGNRVTLTIAPIDITAGYPLIVDPQFFGFTITTELANTAPATFHPASPGLVSRRPRRIPWCATTRTLTKPGAATRFVIASGTR